MTKPELLALLRGIWANGGDEEGNHVEADDALLEFIDDDEITEAFHKIPKWYA